MKVSIVIANWNGSAFLDQCLQTLLPQLGTDSEVVVVDNGSEDESVDMLKREFPSVLLIENKKNLGFAQANNMGIFAARGEYVITMNNDVRVERGFISSMSGAAFAAEKQTGMWAPKILCMDHPDRIDSVGGLLIYPDGIGRGRGRMEIDQGQYDGIREILIPSACVAMYRRSMLMDAGGFDEAFFAYCEDTDLGLRCRLLGWEAKSVPEAIVYHHYSGTTGKYSPQKAYLVERNRQWVVIKNFPRETLLISPFFTLWRFLVQAYGVFTGTGTAHKVVSGAGKISVAKNIFCSYKDAMVRITPVLRQRSLVQKKRKISNSGFRALMKKNSVTAAQLVLGD